MFENEAVPDISVISHGTGSFEWTESFDRNANNVEKLKGGLHIKKQSISSDFYNHKKVLF